MKLATLYCLSILMATAVGCVSSTLPSPLSAAESNRWSVTHLSATVGVETYHCSAYSDSLVTALQNTHLFASVKPLNQCAAPPTLIARIEEPYNGGVATIPIWTFLTLGIVPTVEDESVGYDFSLRLYESGDKHAHIRYICPTTTTGGWIALLEALSPDMTWGSCEWSDRFRGRLALAVLDQLPSIRP